MSRSRRRCCTGCSAWSGCASTRPPARCRARRRSSSSTASPAPRATGCAPPSSPTARRPRPRTAGADARPRRSSAGSTTAGCSTRRWSAAISRCRWPRSARCSGSPRSCPRACDRIWTTRCWPGCGPSSSLVVGALLLLLVGSVVGAAIVNWGFRLVRRGGSLVAVRGLITRRHTELEIDRIRGATVAEGAGMRLVRAARVNALVTGLGDAARRGQLLPLGPRSEAWTLAHRLVEEPGRWSRTPRPPVAGASCGPSLAGLVVTAAGLVATALAGLVGAAGRRAGPARPRRPAGAGPVRRAGPRHRTAVVQRAQRVAGARAGGPAAAGRRRLAGAADVLPAARGPGHRGGLRRRRPRAATRRSTWPPTRSPASPPPRRRSGPRRSARELIFVGGRRYVRRRAERSRHGRGQHPTAGHTDLDRPGRSRPRPCAGLLRSGLRVGVRRRAGGVRPVHHLPPAWAGPRRPSPPSSTPPAARPGACSWRRPTATTRCGRYGSPAATCSSSRPTSWTRGGWRSRRDPTGRCSGCGRAARTSGARS